MNDTPFDPEDPVATANARATDAVGPTDGDLVVLVHGAGISRAMWRPQVEALADGYRVLAVDLPGHGQRDDEPFSFDRAVAAVASAIDAEGGPALVVGHSLGGYVAVELAHRHPDLVRALVLSGSSADYTGSLGRRAAVVGRLNGLIARIPFVERLYADRVRTKLEATSLSRATVEAILDGGVSFGRLAAGGRAIAGFESRSKLRDFDGPVLLINGDRDRINDREVTAALAATLDDAEQVRIPGTGHAVSMQAPGQFTDSIRGFAKRVFAETEDDQAATPARSSPT